MIQFNLLPDVKKQYIKAKRTKRLIISVSMIVSAGALVILILMFSYVQIAQKKNINDLTKDIKSEVAKVESVNGINQILTVQNQLNTLPELHQSKPATSRIFDYLTIVTPQNVFISSVDLDIEKTSMVIEGSSTSIAEINKYADTLKFATYASGDITDGKPFSSVLTELNRSGENASYSIKLIYDPILFDNTAVVTISVPNTVTTRSTLGLTNSDLFKQDTEPVTGENQ